MSLKRVLKQEPTRFNGIFHSMKKRFCRLIQLFMSKSFSLFEIAGVNLQGESQILFRFKKKKIIKNWPDFLLFSHKFIKSFSGQFLLCSFRVVYDVFCASKQLSKLNLLPSCDSTIPRSFAPRFSLPFQMQKFFQFSCLNHFEIT